VLELLRRIGIDKDARAAVLDHEIAFEGFVHDGVIPRSVGRRMRVVKGFAPGPLRRPIA